MQRLAPYAAYPDDERVAVAPSGVARASLHSMPGGRKPTQTRWPQQEDEELLATGTTGYVPRTTSYRTIRQSSHNGEKLTPMPPLDKRRTPGNVQRQHWSRRVPVSLWITLGMCAMAVLWLLLVRIGAWYTNTFYDPAYYTQAKHLDTVAVTDAQGVHFQAHAFVDMQNHLNLLVLPDGDRSHARIIPGSTLTGIDDPQHAVLTVSASGTTVTIVAQGPLIANGLNAYRQSAEWATDISQKQGG